MYNDPNNDDPILANTFFLKHRNLQIFRVERQGSATILWTTRTGVLRYLHALQDELMQTLHQQGWHQHTPHKPHRT